MDEKLINGIVPSEAILAGLLKTTAYGVIVVDGANRILFANARAEEMFGYAAAELNGRSHDDLVPTTSREKHSTKSGEFFRQTRARRMGIGLDLVGLRKDGSEFPVEVGLTPVETKDGILVVCIVTDITVQKQDRELIEHMAYHDLLTALPNRRLFADLAERALATAARENQKLALLFLDLDGFKLINDTLSHDAGDSLLEAVAGRLTRSVRRSDIVARIGGDEFTIILTNIKSAAEAAEKTKKIMAEIARPFTLDKQVIAPSASVGISLFPADGRRRETLVKHADLALVRAKTQGKNSFQFYAGQAA